MQAKMWSLLVLGVAVVVVVTSVFAGEGAKEVYLREECPLPEGILLPEGRMALREEIIATLNCLSEVLDAQEGVGRSLIVKLDVAANSLLRGQSVSAIRQLKAFINEVEAQTAKFRKIKADLANLLIQRASGLIGLVSGPDFDNQEGVYVPADVVIAGGVVIHGGLPDELPCCNPFYIYASRAAVVADCAGFGGPDDRGNALCAAAEADAMAAADSITCPAECPDKDVSEVFRGWDCGGEDFLFARCAVELRVHCKRGVPPT